MTKVIRGSLIFGGVYLFIDGLLHFFNLRLSSVVWQESALSYVKLLNSIYASFVFFVALVFLIIQKDIKKYRNIILITGIWALFHGILLVILSLTQNYIRVFQGAPSLYVYLPFYDQYLILESMLLVSYSFFVFTWVKGERDEK